METAQELRIEDCTSEEAGLELPWEETMRLMPPLLELMDMFNIVCRRCKSNLVDTDLLKGPPLIPSAHSVLLAKLSIYLNLGGQHNLHSSAYGILHLFLGSCLQYDVALIRFITCTAFICHPFRGKLAALVCCPFGPDGPVILALVQLRPGCSGCSWRGATS